MPDKIFTIIGNNENDINIDKKKINEFLENNKKYEVKSVTQIIKPADNNSNYRAFGGAIVVVGERK